MGVGRSPTGGTEVRRPGLAAAAVLTVAAVTAAAPACSGRPGHRLVLDGRPRYPDTQGVVERVDVHRITLDGGRTYSVSRSLQSFSSMSLQTVPLLQRRGQYVQIGLRGHTMVWIAAIGSVVRLPSQHVVFYNGQLAATPPHRIVFRDGTVLDLAGGVTSPVRTGFVRAEIDPSTHRVRRVALP